MKKLPKEFKQYFWEYDFKKIDIHPFKDYVLARIMNFGDLKALKWLSDFYLAGGTALALQIGHRKSVDFDFFTPKDFNTCGIC